MTRIGTITVAIALAAITLPAAAGSWPNVQTSRAPARFFTVIPPQAADGFAAGAGDEVSTLEQYRYVFGDEARALIASRRPANTGATSRVAAKPTDGFEYVGGEGGWEPSQHKYVWSAGGFAHTDECDHAIRTVRAPTLEDLEWARNVSPS